MPKCEKPGCGQDKKALCLLGIPVYFTCERSPEEHRLCARVAELEAKLAAFEWQPIDTAPKDGTDIIVGFDAATVWVAHIAWWRREEDHPDFVLEDVGWWSYVRGSVSQEKLDGHREPTHWIPLPEVPHE